MKILSEFKAFVAKGNVIDLAVGVIIGGAFGKIVESMVKDIITPMIGLVGGVHDFSSVTLLGKKVLNAQGQEVLTGGIMLGNFINAGVSFLILAAVVFFMIVKPMNAMVARINAAPKENAAPVTTEEIKLLTEIRDLLKR